MNLQAGFDGLLALAALWVALGPARQRPALRLACLLLGSAAVLGTLRFSGLLPCRNCTNLYPCSVPAWVCH